MQVQAREEKTHLSKLWAQAVSIWTFWNLSSYSVYKKMNPDLVSYLNIVHNLGTLLIFVHLPSYDRIKIYEQI